MLIGVSSLARWLTAGMVPATGSLRVGSQEEGARRYEKFIASIESRFLESDCEPVPCSTKNAEILPFVNMEDSMPSWHNFNRRYPCFLIPCPASNAV